MHRHKLEQEREAGSAESGRLRRKAGLRAAAVIVAIVAETPVDNSVKITADRAGKKLDFHVLVRDRNDLFKDRERFTRHREDIEIGVQERDVIISVNRQPVTSQDNLR